MIRPLANLYEQLRRLPGIGSKTAMRLAYHVIDMPAEDVKQLAAALSGAKEQIHYCSRCFNLTDSDVCEICRDSSRDNFTICVVEQPQDIAAMEREVDAAERERRPIRTIEELRDAGLAPPATPSAAARR